MRIKGLFYSILVSCSIFLNANSAIARGELLSKKYDWSYNVNHGATVRLENYDCDVIIEASSAGKVRLEIVIDAESENQEDLDILNEYLEALTFQSRADLVSLETVFWDSRNSNGFRGNNSIKIKLKNGESIKLSEFKISANLQIPSSTQLEIESKYSKINIDNIQKLDMDSYDDNIFAGSVLGKAKISAKYSDMEFDEFGPVDFDLYDSNVKATKAGDIELKSKYSNIKIEQIGDIHVEGYDDNLTFKSTGNMKINTKYSDIKSETSGNLTLQIHDSNFEIQKIGNMVISESKYSEYKFKNAGIIQISVSYDDNFLIDNVISVKADNSKYSDYIHENLDAFFEIKEGYDDNVKIYHTSPVFTHLDVNSKYGDMLLKTADGLPLKIDWKTKYGKVDLDEEEFTTKVKIQENSEYEYRGVRGRETENMPLVKVRGYDIKLNIKK